MVGLIVGGVTLVLGIGSIARSATGVFGATRADRVDEFRAMGLSREQAECLADDVEREFGDFDPDLSEAGRDELTEMMRIVLACQGVTGSLSDCVLEGFVDVIGEENLRGDEFIDASQNMSVDDHVRLARVGLECGGLTATQATCVTDTMLEEFGRDTFASPRLELTREQQARMQSFVSDCAAEG